MMSVLSVRGVKAELALSLCISTVVITVLILFCPTLAGVRGLVSSQGVKEGVQ